MKKLLIIASALTVACSVQAASFVWGFTSDEIVGPTDAYNDGGYLSGGSALLYLGTVTASENAFSGYSADKLLATGGQNGDYTFGTAAAGTKVSSANLSETTAGQAYTLVLLADSGVTTLDGYEGYYILAPGSSTQGVNPMDDTDTWGVFQNSTAYAAGNWSKMESVPEPTSGLLMLLGMAGLALRRRRV